MFFAVNRLSVSIQSMFFWPSVPNYVPPTLIPPYVQSGTGNAACTPPKAGHKKLKSRKLLELIIANYFLKSYPTYWLQSTYFLLLNFSDLFNSATYFSGRKFNNKSRRWYRCVPRKRAALACFMVASFRLFRLKTVGVHHKIQVLLPNTRPSLLPNASLSSLLNGASTKRPKT
jgi:hypothetical protein